MGECKKHYREGISLTKIFKVFSDSETAEKWFAERRWKGTPTCPKCGSANVQSGSKHPTMPYRCREKGCGKQFSVKTGTFMQDSNIDYQTWAMLKRGHHGTYHKMSEKHLNRYVNEFAGRHNTRSDDTLDQLEKMVTNVEGKTLTYKQLTTPVPLRSATPPPVCP